MHYLIIEAFVFPDTYIPRNAVGRTIDDLSACVPPSGKSALDSMRGVYRQVLTDLGIQNVPKPSHAPKKVKF